MLLTTTAVMGVVALVSSPAAAPVAIAATVLSQVGDLFDDADDGSDGGGEDAMSGAQLMAAGDGDAVSCQPVPPEAGQQPDAGPQTAADKPPVTTAGEHVLAPIVIGEDGSLDRSDAKMLLEPLSPGTDTLVAQVWFLYRLAGMGDWDSFITAYDAAGLDPYDESEDAPLRQVQTLNTSGIEVERYRLTAASLTAAGQYTGRFDDPYPGYRELVAVELAATCLGEAEAAELPAPSTTVAAPPVPTDDVPEPVEDQLPTP